MEKAVILRIALPVPLRHLFDYLPPQDVDFNSLKLGVRICVPFQSRVLVGILVEIEEKATIANSKLKRAHQILDGQPILSEDVYELCQWAANYYHYALGEVLMSALPARLRKNKDNPRDMTITVDESEQDEPLQLNAAQDNAVSHIVAAKNQFQVFLLDGITGSGKTEVYLQTIAKIVTEGKQVLVMVPEISLTPQTIQRFRARFSVPIAVLHSNLSETKRAQVWLATKSGKINILIGTRSAIFTPFAELGLIVVDEEHDVSFKQQDRFRYHARDLAIMRANLKKIPIVLGSATPSLETLLNVKRNKYRYLSLPERAGLSKVPQFEIININQTEMHEGISAPLLQLIQEHLDRGNQVLLFLNRRGFAPVLYCTQCTKIETCKRCDAKMVYHRSSLRLQCHHCDAKRNVPDHCTQCGSNKLQALGIGTQRLEEMLIKHFKEVPILRIDRDNTNRVGAMQNLLQKIQEQQKAILLGTQMLAKGHHFPKVTLVGIVDADSGLCSVDFRAVEQIGQLLLQVSGRAGRSELPGIVAIQTRQPQHQLLQILIQKGYQAFAETLLIERKEALLPPFSYFAVFRAEAYQEKGAYQFLMKIKEMCLPQNEINILGPVPALLAKRKGLHCQHLLIKAQKRNVLQNFLTGLLPQIEKNSFAKSVKWILEVDPIEV